MNITVPPFSLTSSNQEQVSFPADKVSLVCFVKEDCPTCREVMPVLAAMARALGDVLDFHVVGQTQDGNAQLVEAFEPPFAILDDSSLKVSFASDIDTVPTLVWSDRQGQSKQTLIGFVKSEWMALSETLCHEFNVPPPTLDWQNLPEWRPGCGSLSVDPLIADRLQAEAENSAVACTSHRNWCRGR